MYITEFGIVRQVPDSRDNSLVNVIYFKSIESQRHN